MTHISLYFIHYTSKRDKLYIFAKNQGLTILVTFRSIINEVLSMALVIAEIEIDESFSDEDLFSLIALKDEDRESAEKAFEVFHRRYARLLWSLCYDLCSYWKISDSTTRAKEIYWNTFIAIYQSPNYDPSKAKVSTWIASIAKKEAYDLLKIPDNEHLSLEGTDHIDLDTYGDQEEILLPKKQILEEALDTLSETERDILMTYMRYQCGRMHLPDHVLKELSEYHQKSTDNIRQIKKRAFDKVKRYIREKSEFFV